MQKHRGTSYPSSGGRSAAKHDLDLYDHTGTGRPVGLPDMYPSPDELVWGRKEAPRSPDTEYPTSGRA